MKNKIWYCDFDKFSETSLNRLIKMIHNRNYNNLRNGLLKWCYK